MATDKLLHFIGGAMIFLTVQYGLPKQEGYWRLTPIVTVAAVGIGKEVYDSQHPERHTAEGMDALATVAGGLAAWTISGMIEETWK